jgi:Fe-S-cluster containining protein
MLEQHFQNYLKQMNITKEEYLNNVKRISENIETTYNNVNKFNLSINLFMQEIFETNDYLRKKDLKKFKTDLNIDHCNGPCCCACCYDFIRLTRPEFQTIKNYMIKHDIKIDKRKLKIMNVSQQDFFNLKIHQRRCLFLKDNRCSIYDVRPLVCRNHYVDNAHKCKKVGEGKIGILAHIYCFEFLSAFLLIFQDQSLQKFLNEA